VLSFLLRVSTICAESVPELASGLLRIVRRSGNDDEPEIRQPGIVERVSHPGGHEKTIVAAHAPALAVQLPRPVNGKGFEIGARREANHNQIGHLAQICDNVWRRFLASVALRTSDSGR